MTGDQPIQDLQSQMASLSGKIAQMQQSLGTGGIVMQVRSELSKDYVDIIDKANGGISNQISVITRLISIVSILVPLVVAGIGYYLRGLFLNILDDVSQKEKDIERIKEELGGIQSDVDKFIKGQSDDIYHSVMQNMTNYRFNRIQSNPEDFENLSKNIPVLDERYVRNREQNKNYYILVNLAQHYKGIYCLTYQFFPDLLLLENKLSLWLGEVGNTAIPVRNYHGEIEHGTTMILDVYIKNILQKPELKQYLIDYLQGVYKKILVDNVWDYEKEDLGKLRNYMDRIVKEIGEEEARKEITNFKIESSIGEKSQ